MNKLLNIEFLPNKLKVNFSVPLSSLPPQHNRNQMLQLTSQNWTNMFKYKIEDLHKGYENTFTTFQLVFCTLMMNHSQVVHVEGNTKQRMRHQLIEGPGDNITRSSSLLSLDKVKLSQAGQYTCKPPGNGSCCIPYKVHSQAKWCSCQLMVLISSLILIILCKRYNIH